MDKKFDVAALGELLIDFTESGVSPQGNPLFEANPGGAPCNVLAMLQKLGRRTAFIGKVGDDMFGKSLRAVAEGAGIDMQGLLTDRDARTTLAFVKTLPGGDRDFSFYRNPGADMMLTAPELPLHIVESARVFHFGTLSMTHPSVREATVRAVETARAAGDIISFDPNLRPPLWEDLSEAREQISWGLSNADLVKIADNELQFMTGDEDFDTGAEKLLRDYPNIKFLNVTAGPEGSRAYSGGLRVVVPGIGLGGVIETTGAGDTFCACAINYVLDNGFEHPTEEGLTAMLRFANAAAYLVTTKKGAIRSMPERRDVEAILTEFEK